MSLRKNVIANYLGQGWSGLMGLVFLPLYIQYLGIEAYGVVGVFAMLQAWLVILDMGMSPALGREMARFTAGAHTALSIRDLLRSLELIAYGMAGLITALIAVAAPWLAADWLRVERLATAEVAQALAVTALVIGLRFVESLYRSAITGLQQQVWFNQANALLATLRYSGVIPVLSYLSPTITAFFYWQAAVSLFAVATYALKLRRLLPVAPRQARFSRQALSEVWRFASGMLLINLLAVLLTQVDKVLLSRLLNLTDFGYYTLAATLASGLTLLVAPITQAFYPRLVEHQAQGETFAFATAFHEGAQLVTVITAPIAVAIFLFPEGVVYCWSGDAVLAAYASPLLAPLILGFFLNGIMWMPYHSQLAYGWTSLGIKMNTVAVCLLAPAIIWSVPIHGAVAAAWLWVILNTGYGLIGVQFMFRHILVGEKWRWYGQDVVAPSGAAVAVTWALSLGLTPGAHLSRLEWLGFLAAVTLAALLAALASASRLRPMVRKALLVGRGEAGGRTDD